MLRFRLQHRRSSSAAFCFIARRAERRAGKGSEYTSDSTDRIKMPVAGRRQRHERTGQRAVVMRNDVIGE